MGGKKSLLCPQFSSKTKYKRIIIGGIERYLLTIFLIGEVAPGTQIVAKNRQSNLAF